VQVLVGFPALLLSVETQAVAKALGRLGKRCCETIAEVTTAQVAPASVHINAVAILHAPATQSANGSQGVVIWELQTLQ